MTRLDLQNVWVDRQPVADVDNQRTIAASPLAAHLRAFCLPCFSRLSRLIYKAVPELRFELLIERGGDFGRGC
jgi:hypothetical protein